MCQAFGTAATPDEDAAPAGLEMAFISWGISSGRILAGLDTGLAFRAAATPDEDAAPSVLDMVIVFRGIGGGMAGTRPCIYSWTPLGPMRWDRPHPRGRRKRVLEEEAYD